MKETLHIKNFGPIKEVKLELGKVNVLIGDQGTGKSTVAKLLAIFKYNDFYDDNSSIKNFKYWLNEYDIKDFLTKETIIHYSSEFCEVVIQQNKLKITTKGRYNEIKKESDRFWNELNKLDLPVEEIRKHKGYKTISKNHKELQKLVWECIFIPTERIVASMLKFDGENEKRNIDFLPNRLNHINADTSKLFFMNKMKNYSLKTILGQNIKINANTKFNIIKNSKSYNISTMESGLQSIIPLLSEVLSYEKFDALFSYILEEPELHLFPNTQNKIIQFLINSIVNNVNPRTLTLTTHSPYILTSLNNLMYAYTVGQNHKEKVSKIIPEKYWLNPADVSAYMLVYDEKEGGCIEKNIIDEKEGLIDAENIDGVSNIINEEFNKLINIEIGVENEDD